MRSIVDAHHHLWDLDACHYPWLMARGVKRFFGNPTPIQKNYLVADLRADARDFRLDASVHIQVGVAPGYALRETEWLQQTAGQDGLPSVIVAYVELESDTAIRDIESQQQHARLRGIRQIVGRSAEEDAITGSGSLLTNDRFKESLAALGGLGLSFDLQMIPSQVPLVADVLDSHVADTPIAICHCGSPWDQTKRGLAAWADGLRLLAQHPRVHVKMSGLGMFDHGWDVDSIRPIIETCIDIFGPRRAMFGSNFPVDKLHADYTRVWSAFERITAGLPDTDRAELFGGTARRFYRIDSAS